MKPPTMRQAIQNVIRTFPGSELWTPGEKRKVAINRKPRKKRGNLGA